MADSLPMAQYQSVPMSQPDVTAPQMGMQGMANGANALFSGIQANQAQQALNMQKQQQTIQQVDTLLKSGIQLPGLLPSFWPTIATKMNSLSPDYQLDPNNPPDNILGFAKPLSDISDGLAGGVINPMQAHTATKQLITQTFPTAQDALGGGTAGTPSPSGQPVMQAPPQGGMPPQQGQPPTGNLPQGQPQAWSLAQFGQNPQADFANLKPMYDQAHAMVDASPENDGPAGRTAMQAKLDSSTLGTMYKKSLDMLGQQFGVGAEDQRNILNQNQDSIRSLTSSFESQSQDAKNVFDNLNVFNSQINLSRQFQGAQNTTGAVNAEKASLLAFAQMAYPGTGRPGNMEMLENMEKSGPYGTLISQGLNKIDKGEIMTDSQITGLRQAAVGIAQAREQSQTDQENTTAQAIQMHGGQPQAYLRNYRPSSMASTSTLFPTKGSPNSPLIGEVRKGYKFLGGVGTDKNNWIPADTDGQ